MGGGGEPPCGNLLANPDFETGDFTGWSLISGTQPIVINGLGEKFGNWAIAPAHVGTYKAFVLRQTISPILSDDIAGIGCFYRYGSPTAGRDQIKINYTDETYTTANLSAWTPYFKNVGLIPTASKTVKSIDIVRNADDATSVFIDELWLWKLCDDVTFTAGEQVINGGFNTGDFTGWLNDRGGIRTSLSCEGTHCAYPPYDVTYNPFTTIQKFANPIPTDDISLCRCTHRYGQSGAFDSFKAIYINGSSDMLGLPSVGSTCTNVTITLDAGKHLYAIQFYRQVPKGDIKIFDAFTVIHT